MTMRCLGTCGNLQRADVGENALLVELEEGELDRYGAGGDDDVLCLVEAIFRGGAPARTADVTSTTLPGLSVPRPFAHVILFLRNRNSIPLVFCPTTSSFRLSIVPRSSVSCADADAVRRRGVLSELIMLGRRQQRLGRNAADVDAGAAERLVHLDADGVEAELGGADRGDVAARSAADDDDVGGCDGRGRGE